MKKVSLVAYTLEDGRYIVGVRKGLSGEMYQFTEACIISVPKANGELEERIMGIYNNSEKGSRQINTSRIVSPEPVFRKDYRV